MKRLALILALMAGCGATHKPKAPAPYAPPPDVRIVSGDGQISPLGLPVLVVVQTSPGETLLVDYNMRGAGNFYVAGCPTGLMAVPVPPIILGPQTVTFVPWGPLSGGSADVTVVGQ